jgi:hypothetical protein
LESSFNTLCREARFLESWSGLGGRRKVREMPVKPTGRWPAAAAAAGAARLFCQRQHRGLAPPPSRHRDRDRGAPPGVAPSRRAVASSDSESATRGASLLATRPAATQHLATGTQRGGLPSLRARGASAASESRLRIGARLPPAGQVRSGQVRSGQVRSGQVRSGQVRSGQVRVRSGH